MRMNRVMPFLAMLLTLQLACATRPPRGNMIAPSCLTATPRLHQAWQALNDAMQEPAGCSQDNGYRCETLRAQIERLSVDCPGNSEVVMANALLAFQDHKLVRAQQLLDQLLELGGVHPEAAVLRIRIALEQGNVQFALRFAEQQVSQKGDDAALRETYASVLYLAGRWQEAEQQLDAARQLGAPVWRTAYSAGLIAEAQGKFGEAQSRYQEALKAKPDARQAESRLKALAASGKVSQKNP